MKYFSNISTIEELKNKYRQYVITMHPDKGGSETEFQEMQADYECAALLLDGNAQQQAAASKGGKKKEEKSRPHYDFSILKNRIYEIFKDADLHADYDDNEGATRYESFADWFPGNLAPLNRAAFIEVFGLQAVNLAEKAAELRIKQEQEQEEKREEEEKEAREEAERRADYDARCARWWSLMQDVRPLQEAADAIPYAYGNTPAAKAYKAAKRKLQNARRANIIAMVHAVFPGLKVSVTHNHGWGADYTLEWTDGPTEDEVKDKLDLDLFCSGWDTFDGMTDCADRAHAEFTEFAKYTMGSNVDGNIEVNRIISDETEKKYLDELCELVGAPNGNHKCNEEDFARIVARFGADVVGSPERKNIWDFYRHIIGNMSFYNAPEESQPKKTTCKQKQQEQAEEQPQEEHKPQEQPEENPQEQPQAQPAQPKEEGHAGNATEFRVSVADLFCYEVAVIFDALRNTMAIVSRNWQELQQSQQQTDAEESDTIEAEAREMVDEWRKRIEGGNIDTVCKTLGEICAFLAHLSPDLANVFNFYGMGFYSGDFRANLRAHVAALRAFLTSLGSNSATYAELLEGVAA